MNWRLWAGQAMRVLSRRHHIKALRCEAKAEKLFQSIKGQSAK